MSIKTPMGPGFFIFFRAAYASAGASGGGARAYRAGGAKLPLEDSIDRREMLEELYAELIEGKAPEFVKERASALVEPYSAEKERIIEADAVDWSLLIQQVYIIEQLLILINYNDDEEAIIMLLLN